MSLTAAGLIRVHGPLHQRCPGSGNPPSTSPLHRSPDGENEADVAVPRDTASRHSSEPGESLSPDGALSLPSSFQRYVKTIDRIPSAARYQCATKFTAILADVTTSNSLAAWDRLLRFPTRCLRLPDGSDRSRSLSTKIKEQLFREESPPPHPRCPTRKISSDLESSPHSLNKRLSQRVSKKIEAGDVRGAIRLASANDILADFDEETFSALKTKHPPPPQDSDIPPPPSPDHDVPFQISMDAVRAAIASFPNGSAAGPDKLQPQHLKDMISSFSNSSDSPLLAALVDFCSLVLQGNTPEEVRPFFFGASLVAFRKKQGGVRPIAVGCTLRRLVAKIAGKMVRSEMADLLSPRQLGFGVQGGAEAAVHAARTYLSSMPSDHALVKLDFKNAFNSTRRDRMLEATLSFAPDIFPLVYSAYSAPSHLFWGDRLLSSAEGVQQGDPLGPLLFCLTLFPLSQRLSSRFCVCYLDDVSIGGSCDTILSDLRVVEEAESLGLVLNTQKSEIISFDPSVCGVSFIFSSWCSCD